MVLSMQRWVGKVAIVSGASAGIGEAIAEQLVKSGLQVVAIARRKNLLEEHAQKLRSEPGKLIPFEGDMLKEEDILAAFEFAKTVGPIHVLINNAGGVFPSNLTDGDTENWRKTLDLNVIGLSIATREAVRDMRKNGVQGHIVHINSMLGHFATHIPGMNVYSASKFAVTALTETLRQELNAANDKIKITSVSPGATLTEAMEKAKAMFESLGDDRFKKMKFIESQDVADAVEYVLSTPPHVQVHEVMLSAVGS